MVYFGKRYYDPELSRWLTTDPAEFIDGINLYHYIFNNPFCYIDPDGQVAFLIPLVIWGTELALPSFTAMVTPIIYGAITGAVIYGGYKVSEYINVNSIDTTGTHVPKPTSDSQDEEKDKKKKPRRPGSDEPPIPRPHEKEEEQNKSNKVYAPDRELPRYRDGSGKGEPVPDSPSSHTQLGKREGRRGTYTQAREFDEHGKPVRDIDFTDHDRGYPNPHQHRYKENSTGGTRSRSKEHEPVPEWKY